MKLVPLGAGTGQCRSPPAWGRGLKHVNLIKKAKKVAVAPRVGAWIETHRVPVGIDGSCVAPRVGAWIETY